MKTNWYKIPQRRWTCPHCKTEGWETPSQTFDPRKEHARPDGRDCKKVRP